MKYSPGFILRNIIEKVTGKSCNKCRHCLGGISCDSYTRYRECVSSIYPKGFEKQYRIKNNSKR